MKIVQPGFMIESGLNGMADLQHIERCGRTCYKSEDKITDDSAVAFVRKIIASGHHSVLEHVSATVRIVCDRGVSHEIVRHRLAAYSQESTRYCNYGAGKFGGEITVISPPWYLDEAESGPGEPGPSGIWAAAMRGAERAYLDMLASGASPQDARSVLPNSLKTEIVMTCNAREWRHFFTLRTAKAAHPQMRQIACPMLAEFRKRVPVLFDDVGLTEP